MSCTPVGSGFPEKFTLRTSYDGIVNGVSASFGSTPYLTIQEFSDSSCTKIVGDVAINADGSCVSTGTGSYMFSLQGNTLTGAVYSDTICKTCVKVSDSVRGHPINSGMIKVYNGGQAQNSIKFVSASSNSASSSKPRGASSIALALVLVAVTAFNIF